MGGVLFAIIPSNPVNEFLLPVSTVLSSGNAANSTMKVLLCWKLRPSCVLLGSSYAVTIKQTRGVPLLSRTTNPNYQRELGCYSLIGARRTVQKRGIHVGASLNSVSPNPWTPGYSSEDMTTKDSDPMGMKVWVTSNNE